MRCTCPCSCDETAHDGQPCPIHNAEAFIARRVERAYGLLWRITIDMQSRPGWLTYQARQALLELLDRDGQARGIETARLLEESRNNPRLAVVESRKNPRTADDAFAKYLPNLDNPHSD